MKKIFLAIIISAVSALGISNQKILTLAGQAGIKLNPDKKLSAFLNTKISAAPSQNDDFAGKLPLQIFIHECYKNDVAVFREINSKEYIAAPRDELFMKSWEESCDELGKIPKPSKKTFNSIPVKLKSGVLHLSPTKSFPLKKRWYIVKFDGTPSPVQFEVGDYVGQNAWLVKPKTISRPENIVSAAEFSPGNKIDPKLYSYDSYQIGDSPERRTVNILVLNSGKISGVKSEIIKLRGEIISEIRSIGCVTAVLPLENIPKIAENENIKWIEKAGPPLSICNDGARAAVGANQAQLPPYDYSGTNVDVLVYDGSLTDNHIDYSNRLTALESGSTYYHATHVAGTILGDGSASGGKYRGMAPEARLISGEYDGNGGALFYNNPADIEGDYNLAINTYGADLANNSIGMNIQYNGYPDSYYGDYETSCILIDNIATGLLGRTFLSIWAAGNERNYPIPDFHNISPPQCAKNSLIIGATYSDSNEVTYFSSFGPLDDGRLKPDLCAPGDQTGSGNGIYSTYQTTNYQNLAGTSMATPVATGCATLFTECWREYHSAENPNPAVVKAALINTTLDLDAPGPGYDTGYGLIQIIPALNAVKNGYVFESKVSDNKATKLSLFVPDTANYVRVTIAWSDPPASPLADPVLVNDLDIKLIDPFGGIYYPWTLDAANPANPATNTAADHLNNVEQIFAQNITGGVWEVEISGFNVPVGASQSFALCANAVVRDISPAGTIQLNRETYTAPSEAIVEVKDLDLTNGTTASVWAFSDTEPAGETIILTQSISGVFIGAVPLITNAPASDGFLSVQDKDTISVVYYDADNGMGGTNIPKTATAVIDLTPPFIFNVEVTGSDDTTATIEWKTDKRTKGSVILVTPPTEKFESVYKSAHQLTFSNLNSGTEYQFYIVALDDLGLIRTNNNSGKYFSFSTKFFVSLFNNNAETDYDLWANTSGWHRSQLRPLSGNWSWYCGNESSQEYPDNYTATLETPAITISSPSASLRFKEYVDTESRYDFCYVKISPDGGINWIDLRTRVDGLHPARDVVLSLNNYVPGTFRIRFYFRSDSYEVEEGWYIDNVQIGNFTYSNLVISSTKITDSIPGGNNDGFPNPGETISLETVLLNDMDHSLSNISSTLLTDSPYVNIIQNTGTYGNISAYSYATNSTMFIFAISNSTPDHTSLPFTLTSSDYSGNTWSNNFNIFVKANNVPEGGLIFIILSITFWTYRKTVLR